MATTSYCTNSARAVRRSGKAMDFTFTEEQETIAKVARQLFEHHATPEHLTELEAGDVRHDAALWRELATADLLGIALPESVGGSGHGFLELALLLAEVGWSVAPVPVYATLLLGADTIARHGDRDQQQRYLPDVLSGDRLLTAGLSEPGRSDPTAPATTARHDGDGGGAPPRAPPPPPRPMRAAAGGAREEGSWFGRLRSPTPSSPPPLSMTVT